MAKINWKKTLVGVSGATLVGLALLCTCQTCSLQNSIEREKKAQKELQAAKQQLNDASSKIDSALVANDKLRGHVGALQDSLEVRDSVISALNGALADCNESKKPAPRPAAKRPATKKPAAGNASLTMPYCKSPNMVVHRAGEDVEQGAAMPVLQSSPVRVEASDNGVANASIGNSTVVTGNSGNVVVNNGVIINGAPAEEKKTKQCRVEFEVHVEFQPQRCR